MREIKYTSQFVRDFKRIKRNPGNKNLDSSLSKLIDLLILDQVLASNHQDHPLRGVYKEYRECQAELVVLDVFRCMRKAIGLKFLRNICLDRFDDPMCSVAVFLWICTVTALTISHYFPLSVVI